MSIPPIFQNDNPNKTYTPHGTKEKLNQSSKTFLRQGWMDYSELLRAQSLLEKCDNSIDDKGNKKFGQAVAKWGTQ